MARALWKGAISFGLVYVPVQLYSAAHSATIDLDFLDKRDFSPVGYQRINKSSGEVVEWKNIVRGYQYAKGKYVALSEEDFRQANVKASQTIEIATFVPAGSIDAAYYETPYYVAPDKNGAKVYALLREAMSKSDRIAVANVVIRTRQHLAALLPGKNMLVLNTLRFADEIRAPQSLDISAPSAREAKLAPKELAMAQRLIEEMSGDWEPAQYHDTYREDLLERIQEKVRKHQTHALPASTRERKAPSEGGQVIDLMAVLKKSLAGHGSARKPARRHAKLGNKKSARA